MVVVTMYAFHPYSIVMCTTAALATIMGIYVIRRKASDIGIPFMLLTAAVSIWCVGYLFEINLTDPQAKYGRVQGGVFGHPLYQFSVDMFYPWVCTHRSRPATPRKTIREPLVLASSASLRGDYGHRLDQRLSPPVSG
jgi:hypothetical protein